MSAGEQAGVMLLDKPRGPTCRKVLDELERGLGIGALGHAGTLDPLASGLLVVLAGSARRLQDLFMASTKVYRAEVVFGAVSETLDGEGPILETGVTVPALDTSAVEELLRSFVGTLEQKPPAYSAVHVEGQRSHRLARGGRAPDPAPRKVRIDSIRRFGSTKRTLDLEVTCGPGTYIRSLARDLGERVGCGAWLSSLRRLRSGSFDVNTAHGPHQIAREHLLSLSSILSSCARVDVKRGDAVRLSQGASIAGSLDPHAGVTFAWFDEQPLCRLTCVKEGSVRSDLRLVEVVAGSETG